MPAAAGFTTAIQTKLYHLAALIDAPDVDNVAAAAVAANEVVHTREIADIAQAENVFEFPEFGKAVQTRVAGPSSLGDFSFTFAADLVNAKHNDLAQANAGDAMAIIIATISTGVAGASYWYLFGKVSAVSILNPVGDVKQVTVGLAMEGAPQQFDAA